MKSSILESVTKYVIFCTLALFVATDPAAGYSDFNDLVDVENKANAMRIAGQGREAIPLANHLVVNAPVIFSNHPGNLAACFETAALIYQDQGQLPKAEALLKRVVSIREESLGADDKLVALALNNLANVYREQGRYGEAETLYKRMIAIREEIFGKEHVEVANGLNNLALVYWELSRYAESEKLNKRALAIRENTYGKDHLEVAMSLSNLGALYWSQDRFPEAEEMQRRALAIRERELGKKHPDVAISLVNLGLLLFDQGRYAEAEQFEQRALAAVTEAFGNEHPRVAAILNNLGNVYLAQSRYAEAERTFRQSLLIREKTLGKDHPAVATSLGNLSSLCSAQGRFAEAEPLLQRALAIEEKAFGKEHLSVAAGLNNMGNLAGKQGRHGEAIRLYERSLKIREKFLGGEHQLVATSPNNIAIVWFVAGNYEKAKPLFERALAIWEKNLGQDHVDVALVQDNLGRLASAHAQYAEAEQYFQRALQIREKSLGKDHPDVAETLRNMAESCFKQDQLDKAGPLAERAVAIWDLADVSPWDRFRGYELRTRVRWRMKQTNQALVDLNHALDLIEQVRGQAAGGETGRAEFFSGFADSYETMVAWQKELGKSTEILATIERSRARSLVDQLATANIDLLAGVPADEAMALRQRQATAQGQLAQFEKQAELIGAIHSLSAAERENRLKQLDDPLRAARAEVVNSYLAIRNASPVCRQMVGKDFKPSSLADVRSRLVGADGLLLEYFLADKAGYLVIVPPGEGKARVELLTVSKEQAARLGIEPGPLTGTRMRTILSNEAGTGLLQQLRNSSTAEATTSRLAVLWDVLVPEAERKLLVEGKLKRCILIPDAVMAAFPFDTLVVEPGAKPKYLLDVGPPIVTAPSATLLMNLSDTKPGEGELPSNSTKKSALLSVADPSYGVPSTESIAAPTDLSARSRYGALRGDLKPLPFTGWECSWVTESFRKAGFDAGVLQKASVREASVRTYAPGRTYLHFACHGLVDQSYGNLFGALALAPGPRGSADPADDGFLTLAEIYELNLRGTELSILSACDTNYGPNQKGEGVWSLSRGFLVAGSKRVVASNWLVDDEAGASLVSVFCSELVKERPDEPRDYAAKLQAAKRWVRNQDKWKSPYYWGTFVLVGPN